MGAYALNFKLLSVDSRARRRPIGVSGSHRTYQEAAVTDIPYRVALIVGAGSGISAAVGAW